MNLLLIEPGSLAPDGTARLTGDPAHHAANVLKANAGDRLRIGLLNGPRGMGTVQRITPDEVILACEFEAEPPPPPAVDLLLALPRPKVMRRLWAQLAALGVGRIFLTNAWKVERMYFDAHAVQPEVYRPLLIEGLQQAQDTRLPEVRVFKQFKIVVEDELPRLCPDGIRLMAAPGPHPDIASALGVWPSGGRVLLAVGPEGGWIPYEEERLLQHGFTPVSMGARTLRTDTACLALLTLVHAALAGTPVGGDVQE